MTEYMIYTALLMCPIIYTGVSLLCGHHWGQEILAIQEDWPLLQGYLHIYKGLFLQNSGRIRGVVAGEDDRIYIDATGGPLYWI